MKEPKCEMGFFPHKATEVAVVKFVASRRHRVCEKHKQKLIEAHEELSFREGAFAGELTFEPL